MKRSTAAMLDLDLDSSSDKRIDLSSSATSLVGQVLEIFPKEPGHVIVRWRTLDGQLMDRALAVVRGVLVNSGDFVLLQRPGNWPEWIVTHVVEGAREAPNPYRPDVRPSPEEGLDAMIDGKRVQIEGKDEIVLRCGKASITLRRNGRVVIRGTYVETRSSGTNRIKGGAVLIN
jgi:hypothetical protein